MNRNEITPYIVDVYPDRPQYVPGQKAGIAVELSNPGKEGRTLTAVMTVMQLDKVVGEESKTISMTPESIETLCFHVELTFAGWKGYGADICLYDSGKKIDSMSTAFDVVENWKQAIRYGFLCDFYPEDEDDAEDVKQMAKYHLNAAQFYDWMYRHENLLPETDHYIDPLGRKLSYKAVKNKIAKCREYGIKTMAYGAIYAAGGNFFSNHADWALYNNLGEAISLKNWLVIMNIAPESPWTKHIIDQYKKAVEALGFDGIHLDTYGFPKSAYSRLYGKVKPERLEEHFPAFIGEARRVLGEAKEDIGLIFNAVNNWPVEALTEAEQDAVYIEVWDPHDRYFHLNRIIAYAREKSKKPVILAAYIKPFAEAANGPTEYAENCFLLVSAVIAASGGYHLVLGEKNGVLTEGYYVNYKVFSEEFVRNVRNYYDFIVRYSDLLFDHALTDLSMTHANGINDDVIFGNASFSSYGETGKVWTIIKEKPGFMIINMINLCGIGSDIWNEGKMCPEEISDICVKAHINGKVAGVFLASPDINSGIPEKLAFTCEDRWNGKYTVFTIPKLKFWNLVYIKIDACG